MPPPVISVERLSKRYLVGHRAERGGSSTYTALRDVMGRELRNAVRKAADVVRGRQVVQGDAVEEFWALNDVSFEVQEGEVLGIIGRNGAGKSTLLKILSRITEPTSGRVTLRGRVASLLEVGTGFHPELTGRENIYLNGAILGMSRAEIRKKFDEIVAFAEVEKFLDTPVKRYSSGMYVRLAFAVAAHLEPEILVVDEVLAVGDAEFQKKCLGKMDEVSRRDGRTVLVVSLRRLGHGRVERLHRSPELVFLRERSGRRPLPDRGLELPQPLGRRIGRDRDDGRDLGVGDRRLGGRNRLPDLGLHHRRDRDRRRRRRLWLAVRRNDPRQHGQRRRISLLGRGQRRAPLRPRPRGVAQRACGGAQGRVGGDRRGWAPADGTMAAVEP